MKKYILVSIVFIILAVLVTVTTALYMGSIYKKTIELDNFSRNLGSLFTKICPSQFLTIPYATSTQVVVTCVNTKQEVVPFNLK